jgi:hypothetical protein
MKPKPNYFLLTGAILSLLSVIGLAAIIVLVAAFCGQL